MVVRPGLATYTVSLVLFLVVVVWLADNVFEIKNAGKKNTNNEQVTSSLAIVITGALVDLLKPAELRAAFVAALSLCVLPPPGAQPQQCQSVRQSLKQSVGQSDSQAVCQADRNMCAAVSAALSPCVFPPPGAQPHQCQSVSQAVCQAVC